MQRGSSSDIITIMRKGKKEYYVENSYKNVAIYIINIEMTQSSTHWLILCLNVNEPIAAKYSQ